MSGSQRLVLSLVTATLWWLSCNAPSAAAGEMTKYDWHAARRAARMPWHGAYYHTQYGRPVALVVPPTAHMQTSWGWGVAQTTMTPIYHQFNRRYPVPTGMGGNVFLPTPRWPSHTDQFGVYYVRGPW